MPLCFKSLLVKDDVAFPNAAIDSNTYITQVHESSL